MTTSHESTTKDNSSTFYLYDQIIEGLAIFKKYPHYGDFSAEHDEIFAGPDPETVSNEDKERLAELGWQADYDNGCFRCFM